MGFAALEEKEDHLHLAVVDGAVGLRGSLALKPPLSGGERPEGPGARARGGVSRFDEPGRGGSLRRIREVTLRQGGKLYVRSGEGAFLQEDVEWQVGAVPFLPGFQVSLRLPKKLFL
ncbi:MAG: hypothetical protein QXQ66_06890 [Candidatus Hadarchaeum sp.]|uniref:hypothetical protein n=1 Tax=Candidatus Hadarchaeum sp. TaxID=2883567 RepID=UPI0031784CBD